MPISLDFLNDLQWLAARHPRALDSLAKTAADMVAQYKMTDTWPVLLLAISQWL